MPEADITLYTAATMNGWKPLIFLEESGLNYSLEPIDFSARTHKTPAFLALNPNGKIDRPALFREVSERLAA